MHKTGTLAMVYPNLIQEEGTDIAQLKVNLNSANKYWLLPIKAVSFLGQKNRNP